jgi:hypothetical protein
LSGPRASREGAPSRLARLIVGAVVVVVLLAPRSALADRTVAFEVAAKAGYGTTPISQGPTVGSSPNPLAFGVGGRAGLALEGGLYFGGSVFYYFTGNQQTLNAPRPPGPGGPQTVSTQTLLYGVEMGYGVKLFDLVTVRPQLGFGDATFSPPVQVGFTTKTTWYLQPGVTGLVNFGLLLLGADVDMLVMPISQAQAAFTFNAQAGVRF